jgi:hypothetical protein
MIENNKVISYDTENEELIDNTTVRIEEHLVDEYWRIDFRDTFNYSPYRGDVLEVATRNSLYVYDNILKDFIIADMEEIEMYPHNYFMVKSMYGNPKNRFIHVGDKKIELTFNQGYDLVTLFLDKDGNNTREPEIEEILYDIFTYDNKKGEIKSISPKYTYSTNMDFVFGIFVGLLRSQYFKWQYVSRSFTNIVYDFSLSSLKNIDDLLHGANIIFKDTDGNYALSFSHKHISLLYENGFNEVFIKSYFNTTFIDNYMNVWDRKIEFKKRDFDFTGEKKDIYNTKYELENPLPNSPTYLKQLHNKHLDCEIKFINFEDIDLKNIKEEKSLYDPVMGRPEGNNFMFHGGTFGKNSDGDVLAYFGIMTKEALEDVKMLSPSNRHKIMEMGSMKVDSWIEKDAILGSYNSTFDPKAEK